jgi:hypothetical protein
MYTPAQFGVIDIIKITLALSFVIPSIAIGQTFSPYTPAQIQEFNNQPVAPMETPAGPVYLEGVPAKQRLNMPFDSRYVKNPDGEEQAEAQGIESAVPFEPIPSTFTF